MKLEKHSYVQGRGKMMLAATLLATLVSASLAAAQNQSQLQITSPTAGTIVNPGQTTSVSATSPAGCATSRF
jgi:hypothetical protein